ncbi:hypothetical protein NSK_004408 [Nannochloropsis salina CCMP1776]|uniref:TFIIS N-terminal domain-containing protein n=1 Tax=Nannochloropsis salina CCMP1776 TaxID=1027361 RepID=A0A4D9D358_9STRA|nr:hypothetical protein NSK_004408 [Nannochloropsis salina CCMP1776]|eukprot:TFJ84423.1 hypothetical protein NSK_004408 [Nannochloropsis salina CCMP1776]
MGAAKLTLSTHVYPQLKEKWSSKVSKRAAPSPSWPSTSGLKKEKGGLLAGRGPLSSAKVAGPSQGKSEVFDADTWEACWQGTERREAVRDGVAWLLKHAASNSNSEKCEGLRTLPAVLDMVRLTRDPVRQEVLEAAHLPLEKWKVENAQEQWDPSPVRQGHVSGGAAGSLEGGRCAHQEDIDKATMQRTLIVAVRRIFSLERTGMYAQEESKRALLKAFVSVREGSGRASSSPVPEAARRSTWSIEDYLGWNPLQGPPPASLRDPFDPTGPRHSQQRVLALSVEWMMVLELSGLVADRSEGEEGRRRGGRGRGTGGRAEPEEREEDNGAVAVEDGGAAAPKAATMEDGGAAAPKAATMEESEPQTAALAEEGRLVHVLKWLPCVRPYRGPAQVEAAVYRDQVCLATSVVWALSRGGELRIPALLLPHEYFFLREHLAVQLLQRDVLSVGRTIDALRVLGSHEENPMIRAGMTYLMRNQAQAGNWPAATTGAPVTEEEDRNAILGGYGGRGTGRDRFVAPTLAATRALLVREFNGFGPLPLEVLDLLLAWQKEDADPLPGDLPPQGEDGSSVFLLPDGTWDRRVKDLGRIVTKIKKQFKKRQAGTAAVPAPSATPSSASTSAPIVPASGALRMADTAHPLAAKGSQEAAPLDECARMEAAVLSEADQAGVARVNELGRQIEGAKAKQDWTRVRETLLTLEAEPMSLTILTATSIGRVVNKLKKAEDAGVALLGKGLVKKWKALVEG